MSVAELSAGVREGAESVVLKSLLGSFSPIGPSAGVAAWGGLLRRDWGKSHGVGLNDAWIAATAIHIKRVLLMLNARHFPILDRGRQVVPYKKV